MIIVTKTSWTAGKDAFRLPELRPHPSKMSGTSSDSPTTRKSEWSCAKPFLSPMHLRFLAALNSGVHRMSDISERLGHTPNTLRSEAVPRLRDWGLIYYARGAQEWHLSRPWPETLATIQKRVRWMAEGICGSLDDLWQDPPNVAEWGQHGKD